MRTNFDRKISTVLLRSTEQRFFRPKEEGIVIPAASPRPPRHLSSIVPSSGEGEREEGRRIRGRGKRLFRHRPTRLSRALAPSSSRRLPLAPSPPSIHPHSWIRGPSASRRTGARLHAPAEGAYLSRSMLKEGGRKREREDGKTPTLEAKKERAREMERERERDEDRSLDRAVFQYGGWGERGGERSQSVPKTFTIARLGWLARSLVRSLARSLARSRVLARAMLDGVSSNVSWP